jgi:hypothetical protein
VQPHAAEPERENVSHAGSPCAVCAPRHRSRCDMRRAQSGRTARCTTPGNLRAPGWITSRHRRRQGATDVRAATLGVMRAIARATMREDLRLCHLEQMSEKQSSARLLTSRQLPSYLANE